ncbi:gamma-aminobutyric acid receptor subunit pi-like isoform X1 [Tachypleus tridentatus]|uniref:gamma-aminobutyric acid receptor subunit pi-like isoform X1 n=1 Tax=Tachypleus tridentatus TaxID=6853 RepID=UPI003FD31C50
MLFRLLTASSFLLSVLCLQGPQDVQCNNSNIFDGIIPQGYKKAVAPSTGGKEVDIYITLQIADIYGLDEESMDFYVHMYFDDMWRDERLVTKCIQRARPIILPEEISANLWVPDIYFENSKWGEMFKISVPNTNVKVMQDGMIYRYSRYVLQISCPMDLRFYPMDIQICSIRISLFAHPDNIARLHWTNDLDSPVKDIDAIVLLSPVKLPQFKLSAMNTTEHMQNWNTGNYTTMIAKFTFSRHLTSYIINTYIPSVLVVLMSWLSFWLDVGAVPARVTLGVTSLLTLATQVVQSRSSIPPVAYINALDVWLFFCINMVFATLVEYAISYYITFYKTFDGRCLCFPFQLCAGNIKKMAVADKSDPVRTKVSWVSSGEPIERLAPSSEKRQNISGSTGSMQSTKCIDKISRLIFPFFFLLFNIMYWPYYLTFSTPGSD